MNLLKKINSSAIASLILILLVALEGRCYGESDGLLFIITVDTEGTYGDKPFESMILGKLQNYGREEFGVPKIMDLCDKHGVKATFFVDVYEYRLHGEERMVQLVRDIKRRGHDVQLHTHPAWPPDPVKRPLVKESMYSYGVHSPYRVGMKDYNLEEQVEILREGIRKLERWIGERPVAHRAGGYAADYNMLKALIRVGIPIDASMFYQHKRCGLNTPLLTRNKPVLYRSDSGILIEIPVTCFQRGTEYVIGPFKYKAHSVSTSKVDIDWCNLDELKEAIKALHDQGVNPVTIFLHSYSFVRWDENFTRFYPDYEDMREFDSLLSWIELHPDWKVLTMKELSLIAQRNPDLIEGSDNVPLLLEPRGYLGLLQDSLRFQALKVSWKARAVIILHVAVIAVIILTVALTVRRRR